MALRTVGLIWDSPVSWDSTKSLARQCVNMGTSEPWYEVADFQPSNAPLVYADNPVTRGVNRALLSTYLPPINIRHNRSRVDKGVAASSRLINARGYTDVKDALSQHSEPISPTGKAARMPRTGT